MVFTGQELSIPCVVSARTDPISAPSFLPGHQLKSISEGPDRQVPWLLRSASHGPSVWEEGVNTLAMTWSVFEKLIFLSVEISFREPFTRFLVCTQGLPLNLILPSWGELSSLAWEMPVIWEFLTLWTLLCWIDGVLVKEWKKCSFWALLAINLVPQDQVKEVINLSRFVRHNARSSPWKKEVQFHWLPTLVCMRLYLISFHYPQYQWLVCFWTKCCSEKKEQQARVYGQKMLFPYYFLMLPKVFITQHI